MQNNDTATAKPNMDNPLSRLFPCMRSYISFQKANAPELIFFPYADVLSVGLVFDNGEECHYLKDVELDQLGVSVDEAIDIAVGNLHQISPGQFRTVQAGFYTSPWKDSYDGARLLLTDMFSNLDVDGEVVALTPTPDSLFVTGSKDPVGLELLMQIGSTLVKEANSVLALPLVLRNGLWEPFSLPISDPAFDTVNAYRMNVLSQLYEAQEAMLRASADEYLPEQVEPPAKWELSKGKPELTWELVKPKAPKREKLFVSPFTLANDKSRGYLYSRTSVMDGSINLIPECEIVEFFQRDRGQKNCVARAAFGKVAEVLSNSIALDQTLYPARWRLSSFPTPAQLSALGMAPMTCGYWSLSANTQAPAVGKPPADNQVDFFGNSQAGSSVNAQPELSSNAQPDNSIAELQAIVNIAIPDGAQLKNKKEAKGKESVLEFILSDSAIDLKEFYLKHLKVGSAAEAPTELGRFTIAESLGAACTREAWFGPSKVEGETLLRLIKRVNFSTPSVHNAFIKQSQSLRVFEELFGISLPENVQPDDVLQTTTENTLQNFVTKDTPDTVLQFLRVQMSGPSTVYIPADNQNPHVIIKMNSGLIGTVSTDKTPEGTHFSLAKSLRS
jgi:Protein of unknown function (DUF1444).